MEYFVNSAYIIHPETNFPREIWLPTSWNKKTQLFNTISVFDI
jgi:hypothetical protein